MKTRAFTLIELLIVVAIIGILAAIAVPNFLNARIKAQISRVVSEEKSVAQAYSMYFMDRNAWPPHIDQNRAQHHYVTTPIAYLSTSIIDIFAQSQLALSDSTWVNSQGQYHCEPAYFWLTGQWTGAIKNYPNYFQVQNRNAAFYVMSYGPDQDFDQYKSDAALYEMSNGLTSNGDLITPIQGQYRKGYPYTSSL